MHPALSAELAATRLEELERRAAAVRMRRAAAEARDPRRRARIRQPRGLAAALESIARRFTPAPQSD